MDEFPFPGLGIRGNHPSCIYEEKNKTALIGKLFLQSSILYGMKNALLFLSVREENRKRCLERKTMPCATLKLFGEADYWNAF